MKNKIEIEKKILIAPLNWGLGHATRCIPIINALINKGFEPIICSDGIALHLLQKEFPKLKSFELPSYEIHYTKNGSLLKYRLLLDSPKIINAVKKEKKLIEEIIENENIKGIISDNRFGARSNKIPSVYITHQINVLSGSTSFLTSKLHQNIIAKFDECWIPDYKNEPNLAGNLSHLKDIGFPIKFIGPLSRFEDKDSLQKVLKDNKKFDVMVLLSGPEPQRGMLEKKLLFELKLYRKKVLFVRGVFSDKNISVKNQNIEMVNFMMQKDLQKDILESKMILTRSGYSTIMDLEKLNSKVFFIPTPGQYEQEYLAKYLKQQNISSYALQKDFKLSLLDNCEKYSGFSFKRLPNTKVDQFPFEIFN